MVKQEVIDLAKWVIVDELEGVGAMSYMEILIAAENFFGRKTIPIMFALDSLIQTGTVLVDFQQFPAEYSLQHGW